MARKAPEFNRKSANWPTDPAALSFVERQIEFGFLGELPSIALPTVPRYLVTYMNSQTGGRTRSATVVTVTNQSNSINRVFVSFYKGFTTNASPVAVLAFAIPPEFTVDFSSRNLPGELTTTNSVASPELVFDEGRAIVSSM